MRNYAYGARSPIQNAHLVYGQLRLAHAYKVALTLVEIRRRRLVDALYRNAAPDEWRAHDEAELAVTAAVSVIRLYRSTDGEPHDKELRAEYSEAARAAKEALDAARQRAKIARQAWYDARKRVLPALKSILAECDSAAYAARKAFYNSPDFAELYSSTREKVDESCERAAKAALKAGTMPHRSIFDGGGVLAVRLQGGGLTMKDATDSHDTRFQIELVNAETWQMLQGASSAASVERCRWRCVKCNRTWSGTRAVEDGRQRDECRCGGRAEKENVREPQPLPQPAKASRRDLLSKQSAKWMSSNGKEGRALGHAIVRMRVGSEGKERKARFASFPVMLHEHREISSASKIKVAFIVVQRIGPKLEWKLCLTMDDGEVEKKKDGATLAVNLGWRATDSGDLRVAYAVGTDCGDAPVRAWNGTQPEEKFVAAGHEDIRLLPQFALGMERVKELGQSRAKLFQLAMKALSSWINDCEVKIPEWLAEKRRWMHVWRAPKKLAMLLLDWRAQRFDGDVGMFDAIEHWQKKDRHLWAYEAGTRERNLRMRKEWYRRIASAWAERYQTIIVTDMDLRVFAERASPEASDETGRQLRVQQKLAAPSELREAIKNACATRGTVFKEIKALTPVPARVRKTAVIGPTQRCHACGQPSFFDASNVFVHGCNCGARWDQDYNHCMNLLASASVVGELPDPVAPSETTPETANTERPGRWQKRRARKADANNATPLADS